MTKEDRDFIATWARNYYTKATTSGDEFQHCRNCKHKDKLAEQMPCLRCKWCYTDLSEEELSE